MLKVEYHGIHLYVDEVTKVAYSQEDMDKMEEERIKKDMDAGYRDRMAHFYDKWYRYNRSDNGAAYDKGMAKARDEKKSHKWYEEDEQNFFIIESCYI